MSIKNLLLGLFIFVSISSIAQKKLNEDEVPKDVRIALESTHADAKVKNWAFLNDQYIADIILDNQKGKAYFTPDGHWINSKFPVSMAEMPASVAQFYKDNYKSYKIASSDLVEESGSPQTYIIVLQPQGVGVGEPFKVVFDTKGNLLSNEGPAPEVTAEAEKPAKKTKAESSDEGYADDKPVKRPKPQKVKPEELPAVVPPDVVVKAFMKKFPAAREFTWSNKGNDYIATYEDGMGYEKKVLMTKDGKPVSVTTEVPEDRIMQMSLRYIDDNYPKAKILHSEKVEYDRAYVKSVPEQKLQNYSTITIKVKKNKKYQEYTLMFDKTGKFDSMVNDPNSDSYGDE